MTPIPRHVHSEQSGLLLTRARAGYLVTNTADKFIGECIRLNGWYEEENIDHAIEWMRVLGVDVRHHTFLDVGANIGTHTLWALRRGFQYAICVEADMDNFRLLRANQILNGIDDRCRNILAAAFHENGSCLLELSPLNYGDHRIRASFKEVVADAHGESQRAVREVSTMRLETMLELVGADVADVGLVWIDVQGSEGHVLAGAPALLASDTPMVIEYWPYGLARTGGYELFRSALFDGGRKIYDLRESVSQRSAQLVDRARLDELFASWLRLESAEHSRFTDLLVI